MKQIISHQDPTNVALINAELIERAYSYAEKSKAANTRKAYKSDWSHFTIFCASKGFAPLPASPEIVIFYLTAYAELLKVSTITRHLSAIAEAHRTAGQPSPTEAKEVQLVLRGIRREKGVKQEAKLPLLTDDLRKAFRSYRHDLKGLRDHAILLLGFAGAFRRSELVGLDVS
jgi:site-specific recombinase XerD